MTDNSLIADFADETREHLEELESSLLRLESDPGDRGLLNTIFRSMHTIKGASEYLGFACMAQLSHRLENLLDLFREGILTADKVAIDLLIDARDRMGDLISQVEESGQETATIDDLLDRVAALSDGPAATEDAADAARICDGETDTELFDIFMEQLAEGVAELMQTARRMARQEAVPEAVTEMTDQVGKLSATANYMGYDQLTAVYADMLTGLEAFASLSPTDDADAIDTLLQATVVGGIARIQELFPDAEALAAIDLAVLSVPSDGEKSSTMSQARAADAIAETHPEPKTAAAVQQAQAADIQEAVDSEESAAATEPVKSPSPIPTDIAQLLVDLPSIDTGDRQSLISKTLDDTFSSMHNREGAVTPVDALPPEEDPVALQFSSGSDEEKLPLPSFGPGDDDGSTGIIDDFGNDRSFAKTSSGHTDEMLAASFNVTMDDEVDLWPEAPEVSLPEPEAPAPEPEIPIAQTDFSPPVSREETSAGETPAEPEFSARSSIRRSIRVDAEKVDDLMNQVGELVVNRSSFTQLFNDMRELAHYLNYRFPMDKTELRVVSDLANRLNDATTVLGRVSSELQEQVMKVRMLPISRLFNRYPRLVHDLLRDTDKKIQLQFRGEETELDRMVIEQLADPMIHIIRNAVDHGIESCEARQLKGKPENGILLLEAFHEGSNVIIEVTDDGQGIDLSRIRTKAVEKQLADRETLETMDQRALIDMIMLPGFSTADTITHTSGRGVGMDVVKRNIEKINGFLEIETRQDVGTRIRIKIPLTLAIIPAMMIRCGGSHFTVPMSAVQETLRIDRGEIFTVDGSEVMDLHEEPLSLVRLTELLNMPGSSTDASEERLFVIVVRSATGRTGFIVDSLLGRQEVVIKPLEDYLQENSGFSGATILGDGGISLILNVDELMSMAKEREAEKKLAAAVL
ncbi:MAG: chemotaxis protein CheA [Desulfosarcina sp.]